MKIGALVAALVGAIALYLKSALGDGGMTDQEWLHVVTLLVGSVGVWLIPNTTILATAKTWVMALGSGLVVLEAVFSGGITPAEWADVAIAVLTAAGVLAASTPTLTTRYVQNYREDAPRP